MANAIKKDLKKIKDAKLELALRGVLVTLTGKDEKGNDYDKSEHCDSQFLFVYHLSEYVGHPISVECKSGNDRTATATALICAAKEYEKVTGKFYDPLTPSDTRSAKIFSKAFNKYMLEFGGPNLVASRGLNEDGLPEIKTKKSPPFNKYADMDFLKKKLSII